MAPTILDAPAISMTTTVMIVMGDVGIGIVTGSTTTRISGVCRLLVLQVVGRILTISINVGLALRLAPVVVVTIQTICILLVPPLQFDKRHHHHR